ncbi:hypothetical protein JFL43_04460 [Viridibacillus sp. YIM B01967]|uniref:Lipoprotein n=1 Tax=Viridibacillus soli TaxID=2798301 RepID=A0ABS1H4A3_9BACL|nr:hypothetical protein [Viridibacillus soli]MBK3494121.1 hypothetical protein [Viridibacillus soli]
MNLLFTNKKALIQITLLVLIFLLAGCNSENDDRVVNAELLIDDAKEIFDEKVLPLLEDDSTIEISEATNLDYLHIISFVKGRDEEDDTFGFLLLSNKEGKKYTFGDMEHHKLLKKEPFEVMDYNGNIGLKLNQEVQITLGYINDPSIEKVYVYYDNAKMSATYLNNGQKTFTEISFGGAVKVNRIIGLSAEDDLIHEIK